MKDEPKISTYVKRGLEEAGYAMFNAREALDWTIATAYDLIILDIHLPEIDGLTVCRELRFGKNSTPILMLTLTNLTLDPAAHGATRAGKLIELSAKEFSILEYLLRSANRVLTRTMFAEHI